MPTTFHPDYWFGVLYDNLAGFVNTRTINSTYSRVEFYSAGQPASPADSATGNGAVLLSTHSFSGYPYLFSPPVDGVVRLINPVTGNSDVSGLASWARIYNSYGSSRYAIIDTPVSLSGGGGGVILDTLNLVSGENFQIEALAIAIPEAHGDISLSLALRNGLLNSMLGGNGDACAIGDNSTLSIYTGSKPSSIYDAPTGTKLADFVSSSSSTEMWQQSDTSGSSISSTESSWNVATTVGAGVPGWFQILRGSRVLRGTCGTSGANCNVDKASVSVGESLTITEMNLLPG